MRILIVLVATAGPEVLPPPNVQDRIAELRLTLSRRESGRFPSSAAGDVTPAAGWQVYTTLAHPTITPDGAVWWVNAEAPPQLMCGHGDCIESFPLDVGGLPHENLWYLASDTKGRIWVFGNLQARRAAFFDHSVWRTFRSLDNAFRIVAREEKGNPEFRIGDPRDAYYPAFAGDGRVAYRESDYLAYFDGHWWNRGGPLVRHGGSVRYGCYGRTDRPPFYVGGVLTVRMDGQYYQLSGEQWQLAQQAIEYPYDDILPPPTNPRQQTVADLLQNRRQETIHLQDNVGTTWTGSAIELRRTLGSTTIQFPSVGSLLSSQDRISEVFADAAGRTWFILSSDRTLTGTGSHERLVVYDPNQDPPQIEWNDRPPDLVRAGNVVALVRVTDASGATTVLYQCDGGSWQRAAAQGSCCEIPLGCWLNGVHVLRVQAHDRLLRPSNVLSHTFQVTRDHGRETRTLVELLGSADLDERELAARALVTIGKPIVPALKERWHEADVDQRWWIQAVLDEIGTDR